jgi:hypothetical protein
MVRASPAARWPVRTDRRAAVSARVRSWPTPARKVSQAGPLGRARFLGRGASSRRAARPRAMALGSSAGRSRTRRVKPVAASGVALGGGRPARKASAMGRSFRGSRRSVKASSPPIARRHVMVRVSPAARWPVRTDRRAAVSARVRSWPTPARKVSRAGPSGRARFLGRGASSRRAARPRAMALGSPAGRSRTRRGKPVAASEGALISPTSAWQAWPRGKSSLALASNVRVCCLRLLNEVGLEGSWSRPGAGGIESERLGGHHHFARAEPARSS